MKRQEDYKFDLVTSIMFLEEILSNHIHEDELVGNFVVVPIEKIQKSMSTIRANVLLAFDTEIHKKNDKRYNPLRDAVSMCCTPKPNNNLDKKEEDED